jgi:uncharacterized protein YjfI (DUF2170 family)
MNLEELAFKLNTFETNAGSKFAAEYSRETETLKVTCDLDPEATIFVVVSEEQILSVTPLFHLSEIAEKLRPELYKTLLRISPLIPLSSVGLQNDDTCILFGAMSVNSPFENIAHELERQADNYNDTLAALANYFETEASKEA